MKVSGEEILLHRGDVLIKGRISHVSLYRLEAEITSPYQGIRGEAPILPEYIEYSRGYIEHIVGKDDPALSAYGRLAASRVLEEIYLGCSYFETHKTELAEEHHKLLCTTTGVDRDESNYHFFLWLVRNRHLKISYSIVKQLIDEFLGENS
jgi:hypothetical protein